MCMGVEPMSHKHPSQYWNVPLNSVLINHVNVTDIPSRVDPRLPPHESDLDGWMDVCIT